MISENSLVEEYGAVEKLKDLFFFQEEMKTYTYYYWLKPSKNCDFLVISQDHKDHALAATIIDNAPESALNGKPYIYKLPKPAEKFSHVLVVPGEYHSYLDGVEGATRERIALCIPIHRCEFSGDESIDEFKYMRLHLVPILEWQRDPCPKLRVYFDNPKTGGGTTEAGALLRLSSLLLEVENLNGVSDGFIEITNYSGTVVEVLSPKEGSYILIHNREDEEAMSQKEIILRVEKFAKS
jgi:hypothetical protein